ncbi:MAG: DUF2920 family protein [Lachnoclostridium sp.]|nr:DUF2920 family protein [Lachnospira sp.]MCM1249461.1 DUF2920 family protein [Lachnoclostridium sp.]
MAQIIEKEIETHKNIYEDTKESRFISVRIGVPFGGVNDDTNMLILSYGYEANCKAHIFTKLLQTLPDKYNLTVVCGEYFGAAFMDNSNLTVNSDLTYCYTMGDETAEEFNDMGILQGLDTVYMTLAALDYIGKKAEELKHIILFGSSHGAYISHMANLFCPDLYTYVLDISGYISPYYMPHGRRLKLLTSGTECGEEITIKYLVSQRADLRYIPAVYDLGYLYASSENNCRIIALQGKEDWMVDWKEKENFIKSLGNKAEILLFAEEDIDGEMIQNADHSLGLDFVKFFDMILPMILRTRSPRKPLRNGKVVLGKGSFNLMIDYSMRKPVWRPENNVWLESNR